MKKLKNQKLSGVNVDLLHWSEKEYDKLHKGKGFYEEREYYEVLATLLKGKKAIDIGCGEGYVEHFAPEITAVDFSSEALKRAKKNGAKHLVKAPAEALPFGDNTFEVALSAGTLEHLVNQQKAIEEMGRVAKVQIIIAHAKLPWLYEMAHKLINLAYGWKQDQPLERPLSLSEINAMLSRAGLKVIFQGIFNYVDLRWLWKGLPYGLLKIPSHYFIVSIKSEASGRRFLKEESGWKI
ncbi:MAG: class I SAM-dependent methyltransferase [Patescibacteria group bacterium]